MEKKQRAAVRLENPLMPDERLRQMYTTMVQVRMLEEDLQARARRGRARQELPTMRGEEAARAATALSLETGDLLSDCVESPGMDLLLGAPLAAVRGRRAQAAGAVAKGPGEVLRLPVAEGKKEAAEERLQLALGAAAALRAQGGGRVVLVYARAGEMRRKQWKRALHVAGRRELPVIFAVLPEGDGELARRARGWGVPGFPVDGADAIGLYRVMQESLGRARTNGGPALIECIPFEVDGAKKGEREDPIERLEALMLAKGAATAVWLGKTRSGFGRRLGGGRK